MTTLYLIRHAPTNLRGVYCGQYDAPCRLPESCDEEAKSLLESVTFWHASDLARAKDSAHWLMKEVGSYAALQEDAALREQNFGAWENQDYERIYRENTALDWSRPAYISPPGGERFIEVISRVEDWLDAFLKRQAPMHAVIAHAGSIRAILAHAESLSPEDALNIHVSTGSISAVHYHERERGGGRVLFLNRPCLRMPAPAA